jgi:hypothetical protein
VRTGRLRGRTRLGILLYALNAGLLAIAGACYPIGAILYKTVGPMPVDAQFIPDNTKPMLVFVERFNNAGGAAGSIESMQECENLARAVQAELQARAIAPQVDAMSVAGLRAKDPLAFRAMTISQIGGEVGAHQVLYVNLMASSLKMTEGSDLMRGQMAVRVKVIDVASGQVLWPSESTDGQLVSVQTPIGSVREGVSKEEARVYTTRMMADAIVKLFYKHQPEYDAVPE